MYATIVLVNFQGSGIKKSIAMPYKISKEEQRNITFSVVLEGLPHKYITLSKEQLLNKQYNSPVNYLFLLKNDSSEVQI